MAKLRHITFTGIDGRTDLGALWDIQQQYPIAEFGVLVAKNWRDNGNRYFNPSYLQSLDRGLNLSAHFCGSIARAAVRGDMEPWREWTRGCTYTPRFSRCQLNVATSQDNPDGFYYRDDICDYFDEVILQQQSIHDCWLWIGSEYNDHVTVLIDASGGQGIDTPIEVLPIVHKVGYAGGINPDNVGDKLRYLLNNPDIGDFWIDMESGVRTNDWFDLEKVKRVLEICQPIIDEKNMNVSSRRLVDCGLSVRTLNALHANGIETIGDLTGLSKTDVLRFRTCGHKTLVELDDFLEGLGLSFKQ